MDHLVLVDGEAKELDRLIDGHKTVIIRTSEEEEIPFQKVQEGERLYFFSSGRPGVVLASADVKNALFRGNLAPDDCTEFINRFLMELMLTEKQLSECEGKPFLSLIRVEGVRKENPFSLKEAVYRKIGHWEILENIDTARSDLIIM